ncbi:carboxypeptidase-like regulatory domain-containing protein [Neptunitalea lumnitzerae]|nr:carboxypeptidase-like regulatory domain-containing protein [Neptunitalea sp. Y10]
MKTTSITTSAIKTLGVFILFMCMGCLTNTLQAQTTERTVTGKVSAADGPLENVGISLKGSTEGTVTDKNGAFTFPKKLSTGDVLVISYLGFKTQEIKLKDDTSFIEVTLEEEYVTFTGAPNSEKPYKSKRSKE